MGSKQSDFEVKMKMPFEFKKAYAEIRVNEFIRECGTRNLNYFVSVGGIDSLTLLCFVRSLGYDIDGVSVSSIEDKSVREVQRYYNVIEVKPFKSKYHIIKEIGYPLFSKETAHKINTVLNPTGKNDKYINAILTGQTARTGKSSKMVKLADKYIKMINDNVFDNIKVSDKCCDLMKEKPVQFWAKENNAVPFLGLQASESRRRFMALSNQGCNYFGTHYTRSCPFAIFNKSDVLQLALEIGVKIPKIYGAIEVKDGIYYTTGKSRTGCDICGFGIQYEKTRPHRFDNLHDTDFKNWDFWVNQMGYGEIFKRIGFKYEQPYIKGEKSWK